MPQLNRAPDDEAEPISHRDAFLRPETFDDEKYTVEAVLGTEEPVRMWSWQMGRYIDEVLVMDETACDLTRVKNGRAPVQDTHWTSRLSDTIGKLEDAWFEGRTLVGKKRLSRRASLNETIQDIKDGIHTNTSLGYMVLQYEITERENDVPLCRAVKWVLHESSFVPVGADQGAGTRAANDMRPAQPGNPKQEKTMSKRQAKALTRTQTRAEGDDNEDDATQPTVTDANGSPIQADGSDVIVNADGLLEVVDDTPDGEDDGQRSALRERQRIQDIRAAARAFQIEDEGAINIMIERNVSPDKARTLMQDMRAAQSLAAGVRSQVSVGRSDQDPTIQMRAMEDAVVARATNAREVPAEARQFMRMGMLDIGRRLLEMNGVRAAGDKESLVHQLMQHRSMTSSDLPNLLGGAGNRILLDTYHTTVTVYEQIAGRQDFSDFRPMGMITASSFPDLKEVSEGGDIEYGTLSESAETMQGKTYGRNLKVTRQMLINDDLNLFAKLTTMIGRRAANKHNKLVVDMLFGASGVGAKLADGNTLFHASHKNLLAAGTFDATALEAAEILMRAQTELANGKGDNVNLSPVILLTAGNLVARARALTGAITPNNASDINYNGILTPLADNNIPAGRWALLADPVIAPAVNYGFLQGNEGPKLEQFTEARTDGVVFQIIDDFAVAPVDYRPAVQGIAA